MFPLYDQYRLIGKNPQVLRIIIGLNIILFLFSFSDLEGFIFKFGLIPERIFQGEAFFTLFSSMFFHGGFSHLFGNMWFL